jgi:predicted ArsR family transcriptional regulator
MKPRDLEILSKLRELGNARAMRVAKDLKRSPPAVLVKLIAMHEAGYVDYEVIREPPYYLRGLLWGITNKGRRKLLEFEGNVSDVSGPNQTQTPVPRGNPG